MIMIIRIAAMIGEIIASARNFAGMSQAQLSAGSGVDSSQISKYETVRVIPDLNSTRRLLSAAGWTLAALPMLEAETHEQREQLIAVVRKWAAAPVDQADAFSIMEAVGALDAAEKHVHYDGTLPPAEQPGRRLERLERQLELAQTQLAEYEAIFGELGNAVRKATARVLAGDTYAKPSGGVS